MIIGSINRVAVSTVPDTVKPHARIIRERRSRLQCLLTLNPSFAWGDNTGVKGGAGLDLCGRPWKGIAAPAVLAHDKPTALVIVETERAHGGSFGRLGVRRLDEAEKVPTVTDEDHAPLAERCLALGLGTRTQQ
jgi:hypothetical protein